MLIFSILSPMIEVLSDTLNAVAWLTGRLKTSTHKGERFHGEKGNHKEEVRGEKNQRKEKHRQETDLHTKKERADSALSLLS
jgi:hypothetical protein